MEYAKAQLKKSFKALDKADKSRDGLIQWEDFASWMRAEKQSMCRDARKLARTLFEMADDDNSGFLDEEEVGRLHKRLFKEFPAIVVSFDPPFDLASDFAEMDRVRL